MIKQLQIRKMQTEIEVLVPLNEIIGHLLQYNIDILDGMWTMRWNDMGLGGPDFSIEGDLIDENVIRFAGERVFPRLLSENIYFDHGAFTNDDGSLVIGIFDSSFIFINGDDKILESISSIFDASEIEWVIDI